MRDPSLLQTIRVSNTSNGIPSSTEHKHIPIRILCRKLSKRCMRLNHLRRCQFSFEIGAKGLASFFIGIATAVGQEDERNLGLPRVVALKELDDAFSLWECVGSLFEDAVLSSNQLAIWSNKLCKLDSRYRKQTPTWTGKVHRQTTTRCWRRSMTWTFDELQTASRDSQTVVEA